VLANRNRTQFGVSTKSKSPRKGVAGRICQRAGCATVLSIYNRSEDCSLHELRTRKPPLAP